LLRVRASHGLLSNAFSCGAGQSQLQIAQIDPMTVQKAPSPRHSGSPNWSAAADFYDSRAAAANEVHNHAVCNADYVLNSLFRGIVFPVPPNRIPCSAEPYSLFRAQKFPDNLTGNLTGNA
jgi:hypothetical protein